MMSAHLITEVKKHWTWLVLGWVTLSSNPGINKYINFNLNFLGTSYRAKMLPAFDEGGGGGGGGNFPLGLNKGGLQISRDHQTLIHITT